jgi:hypothetical protein
MSDSTPFRSALNELRTDAEWLAFWGEVTELIDNTNTIGEIRDYARRRVLAMLLAGPDDHIAAAWRVFYLELEMMSQLDDTLDSLERVANGEEF